MINSTRIDQPKCFEIRKKVGKSFELFRKKAGKFPIYSFERNKDETTFMAQIQPS